MGIFPPPHLLTRPEVSAHKQSLQSTFSAMHWASLGLLSSLVLVITLAKLKRHPVLLSMFAAFVTNDIFNLLTFRHPVHPSWSLCLVSQAGTTAGTALGTTSVMSMVLVIWSLLRDRAGKKVMDRGFVPLLVCLPWAIFILIFALSIITTSLRPNDLYVEVMTCYAENIYTDISHAIAVLAILVALVFDVWGIILYVRNWRETRSLGGGSYHPEDNGVAGEGVRRASVHPGGGLNRTFTIRVLIFGTALVAALGAAFVIILVPQSHAPALFQSSIGLIGFALFGTQRDTFDAIFSRSSSLWQKVTCTSSAEHYLADDKAIPSSRRRSTPPESKKGDDRFQPTVVAVGPDPTPSLRRLSFTSFTSSPRLSFGAMFRTSPRPPQLGERGLSDKTEEGDGWDDAEGSPSGGDEKIALPAVAYCDEDLASAGLGVGGSKMESDVSGSEKSSSGSSTRGSSSSVGEPRQPGSLA